MKKITILFISIMMTIFVTAQSNTSLDIGPKGPNINSAKGSWTVQFNHSFVRGGAAGCETDGTYFYVTLWSGNTIWKLNMSGTLVDSFSISGVTGLRDLAYDGTYFYGGASGSTIYKMNFTNKTLISTISSPNVTVRNICYDPNADNGNGAFWVGNWATDFSLVSRSGTVLSTISSANHGLSSTYGTAYDTISAGGPYIWAISAGNPANTTIFQIDVATGMQTGLTHDITTDIASAGDLGGGLWIETGIVSGTATLGGLVQGKSIFGYNLSTTASDSFDMELSSLNIPNLIPVNQNTDIKGSLTNQGSQTITSYNLNYRVDNGSVVTDNVTGVNIASYQSINFTHSTPYVATNGMHTIEVWTSNPNGNMDQNPSNDTMIIQAAGYDPSSSVQRIPLYETFTSSTCSPCVAGNNNMQALFAANTNKWVCVKYQMSWPNPGDPYFTDEGEVRRNFYGVNSVPRQEIDGGYDGNSSAVTQADFDAAYAVPSFMAINANLTLGGHMITVDYTIDPKISFPANAKLYIAIVEKNTFNNVGSNGETEFHWVMKKMLPDASGTTIGPLTANTTVSNNIIYNFKGSYRLPNNASDKINHSVEHSVEDFNNLLAVVWVQNPSTKEVYQSAFSTFTLGMDTQTANDIIKSIYPNPASDIINIELNIPQDENVIISLYNNLGQEITNYQVGNISGSYKNNINISNLPKGIYFVNIVIGDKKYSKPIIIQ